MFGLLPNIRISGEGSFLKIKSHNMKTLSVEELKEFLHYNPETGIFTWVKDNKNKRIRIGCVAGTISLKKGYITIKINKVQYQAHRLAWLYMTGEMPENLIDHKNTIRSDNRFDNLREATNIQNLHNQVKPQKNNKTGFLGVSLGKGKYRSQISIRGTVRYLGLFVTAEEAHQCYLEAKRELHPFCMI